MIAAEGDGKRAGIYNLAYALADAVKGQSVITVAACHIAKIGDLEVIKGINAEVGQESGIANGDRSDRFRTLRAGGISADCAAAFPRYPDYHRIVPLYLPDIFYNRQVQPRWNPAVDIVGQKRRIVNRRITVSHKKFILS